MSDNHERPQPITTADVRWLFHNYGFGTVTADDPSLTDDRLADFVADLNDRLASQEHADLHDAVMPTRHYDGDNCNNPDHNRILAAWYAQNWALLNRGQLDVERLARYEEHVGGLHCPKWHHESCEWQERCDEPGCKQEATCGFRTDAGYRRTCNDHSRLSGPVRE